MDKLFGRISRVGVISVLSAGLIAIASCDPGVGFLGLQDYQRDLLVGGLLAGVLLGDDSGGADPAATQGVPGVDGADGAAGSPGVDGAQGPNGTDGADGDPGAVGPEGAVGSEGSAGASGPVGTRGAQGEPGAGGFSFFTIFVDDFFTIDGNPTGDLPVNFVSISEPSLGAGDGACDEGQRGEQCGDGTPTVVAYRVAIPEAYEAGNDVTMRLFFLRTGDFNGDCFVFSLDAARLRAGEPVQPYGDTVWVRVDGSANDGVGVFVDLVINSPAGLDYPDDLAVSDFLAFELNTLRSDGGLYHLLGVEFYEFDDTSAQSANATIFVSDDEVECECDGNGLDCNDNGVPDNCDIESGTSNDCNEDGVPDECQLDDNDCNSNRIPDDCDGGCDLACECVVDSEFVVPCGPVSGPCARSMFEQWHSDFGGRHITFNEVPSNSRLTTQIPGVSFQSISNVNGDPSGPNHVMASTAKAPATFGNTLVGSPFPNGVDDGRVIYQAIFDAPQRRAGIFRIWPVPITSFYSADGTLLHEFSGPDNPTGFYGFVAESDDPATWVKRVVMSGDIVGPGTIRQVGYSDDLFFGTTIPDLNTYGSFFCYDEPEFDEVCNFACADDSRADRGNGECISECDVPSGTNLTEETTISCIGGTDRGGSRECQFTVSPPETGVESLTGWWRFEFHALQVCEPGNADDFSNELRYLRFDENNELVENFIIIDPKTVEGDPQCLQVFYPSDDGPNYLEVSNGAAQTFDTHREITAHSFDATCGALSLTELVDVPNRNCFGEEGSTFINAHVSGDTLTGTWEFQFSAEAGLFGKCIGAAGLVCGPVEAQRTEGPPACDVINPGGGQNP